MQYTNDYESGENFWVSPLEEGDLLVDIELSRGGKFDEGENTQLVTVEVTKVEGRKFEAKLVSSWEVDWLPSLETTLEGVVNEECGNLSAFLRPLTPWGDTED